MTPTRVALSPTMRRAGRVPARLLGWGVPLGPLRLLRTRGHRSGLDRTVPVALLDHDGDRWLVSPFGDVGWVRNVRANGAAALGRGRRMVPVVLEEVTDGQRPVVLHAYRLAYRGVPFVRAAFDADRADADGSREQASRHPVFRIRPAHGRPR